MREIKFRAFQDNQMLISPISSNYGLTRFFGMLYEDAKLMQFTGLQDKNGVDIYEGDMLQFVTFGFNPEFFTTEIIYKDCAFKLKDGRSLFYFGQTDLTKLDDAKIIGNIYENKI